MNDQNIGIGTKIYKPLDTNEKMEFYANRAVWCNENGAFIEDCGAFYEVKAIPEPTLEELEAQALAEAKNERAEAVSKITVEVDGMTFDGDEKAQTRIGRTVAAAVALGMDLNTEKRTWVLADNSVAQVTINQLVQVLRLAGDKQTELWTVPYTKQEEANTM